MSSNKPLKFGYFNKTTETVRFGGPLSKPHNRFDCTTVKVPEYKYKVMERADAGGGCYYSYKEEVEYTERNAYLIFRDGQLIGYMRIYGHGEEVRCDLWPMDSAPHPVTKFSETLKNNPS